MWLICAYNIMLYAARQKFNANSMHMRLLNLTLTFDIFEAICLISESHNMSLFCFLGKISEHSLNDYFDITACFQRIYLEYK